MNERNVASFESSKKLVDNGIVLDTECYWCRLHDWDKYELKSADYASFCDDSYPAPCFTEVWRELPEKDRDGKRKTMMTVEGLTIVGYTTGRSGFDQNCFSAKNPTDALIKLLIWVRKEKP